MTTENAPASTVKKPVTESFLLNIYYPLAHKEETKLVGTLEKLGSDVKNTFHTTEELLHMLGLNIMKSGGLNNEHNK